MEDIALELMQWTTEFNHVMTLVMKGDVETPKEGSEAVPFRHADR